MRAEKFTIYYLLFDVAGSAIVNSKLKIVNRCRAGSGIKRKADFMEAAELKSAISHLQARVEQIRDWL